MRKSLMVAAAAATLSLGAAVPLAANQVSAESGTSSTTLVDKIASKFNLNKDEVQQVFDENREARQAEHEQAYKDKLAAAVKAGTLTQEQADKAQAKHDELKAEMEKNREAFKDMTHEERHAAMDKKRTELKQWAQDNGIDESYVMPGGPGGHRGGMHGPGSN
jgi:hypothetical protein